MKKILLIVLLLSVGFSQQIIHTETYENGNIKSITYHKKTRNGIEKVKYEEYYYNGQKKKEYNYKDGILISEKHWNEDGSVNEDKNPSNEHPSNEHPSDNK